MAFAIRKILAFSIITTLFQVSLASVYEVGDSAGWTLPIFGIVNYSTWASNKTFYVGDVVVFSYNSLFDNVRQVNQEDFQSCNATSPIASYSSGNDSVTLEKPVHYYFISGVQFRCQIGEKVDFNVSSVPVEVPSASPAPAPSS